MESATRTETLRERARRAVRGEILDASQALFAQHGFEAVTIEQIAEAVGMSKRSFFRYFASKEALVLGKYDRQGEQFAEALAARPAGEDAWTSLRRMFDDVVAYISDPELARRAAEMDRIINSSESLRAGFLERMQRAQHLVVTALREREPGMNELAATVTVAAAFAALSSAHAFTEGSGRPLDAALDEALAAIRPSFAVDGKS